MSILQNFEFMQVSARWMKSGFVKLFIMATAVGSLFGDEDLLYSRL